MVHNIATHIEEKVKENRQPLDNSFAKNISRLGLKVRKNQEKIAEKIKEELAQSRPSFIEAPTGIGKTYAYLLPLLAEGREIVVSTPTKVLQNQMIHGVAPILKEKFGVNFSDFRYEELYFIGKIFAAFTCKYGGQKFRNF